MAGYTITYKTTIQNLKDAKKIYEKLNNANPAPNPQQKAKNDAAIQSADNAIKHIENVRKKYAQVYPDIPYLSSSSTLLSLEGIQNALATKGAGLSQTDKDIVDKTIGVGKTTLREGARNVGSAIFHDKDGKFSVCKLEVAGIGLAAGGLLANKTVGKFIIGDVLPLIGTAVKAIFGFSPLTAIGLGIFAGAKLFKLGKKLLGPVINRVQQNRSYSAERNKSDKEAEAIGKATPTAPKSENHNLFEQRLMLIGGKLPSPDPNEKADAQKDLFRVMMEIRDAGPDVLTPEEKTDLLNRIKTDAAFAGVTQKGDGLKERFTNSAPDRSSATSDFNTKVDAVKNAIKDLNVSDPSKVNAVETAITQFEGVTVTTGSEAEKLKQLLIAQFRAELEYAKAHGLDASKVKAAHNANANELEVGTELNIS